MSPVVTRRKPIQVQLAKVYNQGDPLPFNQTFVEDKYDGLRGIINVTAQDALTRTGLDIPNADLVLNELFISGQFDGMVLDGEFLAEDWNLSQSIVKSQSLHPERDKLRFKVFDIIDAEDWLHRCCTPPLRDRKADLLYRLNGGLFSKTQYAEHKVAHSVGDIEKYLKDALKRGLEGIMLKDPNAPYAFKKHASWLKYKPIKEGDFTIEGAVEGRGKHEGRLGALKFVGFVGKTLVRSEVGTGFDDAQREEYWTDHRIGKLVGRTVEVHYQEVTEDGALRFPVFFRMRDDK